MESGGAYMQIAKQQLRKEALEEFYLILAEFYKLPTIEFYQELADGLIENRLKELADIAGYNITISLENLFKSYSDMQIAYMNCFMGTSTSFAPPIESVYKVWTTDPSAELAMANEKGYLYGDSASHIEYLFRHYQLEIPEEYRSTPDHLTLLLEFLTYLINEQSESEVVQLINDHFDWLGDYKKELSSLDGSEFYLNVTEIVKQAVHNELKWHKDNSYVS